MAQDPKVENERPQSAEELQEEYHEKYGAKRLELVQAVKQKNVDDAKKFRTELLELRKHTAPEETDEQRASWVLVQAAMAVNWTTAGTNKALKAVFEDAGGFALLMKDTTENAAHDPRTPFIELLACEDLEPHEESACKALLMLLTKEERRWVIAPFSDGAPEGEPYNKPRKQQTAFYAAAWFGRSSLLKDMIECVDQKDCRKLLMEEDWVGCNTLHVAINREHLEATKVIVSLDNCRDRDFLTAKDNAQRTALHMAMACSNPDIAIVLLQAMPWPVPLPREDEDLLDGVFTYALKLNMSETITAAAKALPNVFGEEMVAQAFRKTNTIGEFIALALAPPLEVNTETGTLWLPLIDMGNDPWVREIQCREPKAFEQKKMTKTGWQDKTEVRLVLPQDEQQQVEKGPPLHCLARTICCSLVRSSGQGVRCTAHRLPKHLLTSTEVVRGLTNVSSALRTPLARGVLARWWVKFEPYYHLDIFLNGCHLVLAGLLTFASRNGHTVEPWFYACLSLQAALVLKDLLDEMLQFRFLKDWTADAPQLTDYGRVILETWALVDLSRQPSGEPASVETKTVTAGWVFLWWCHFLLDLRGLRSVGPRLMPIFSAVNSVSVRSFVLLVVFLLGAATHAYYVLAVQGYPFHIYSAVLAMYRLGVLGDFDMFELEGQDPIMVDAGNGVWEPVNPLMSQEYVLVHILFYAVTMLVTVILMNLFIGVVGSAYNKYLDMAEELFTSTRAELVLEYEVAFVPWLVKKLTRQGEENATGSNTFPVVFTREEVESSDQSMRNFVRNEISKSTEDLRADQKGISESTEDLRADQKAISKSTEDLRADQKAQFEKLRDIEKLLEKLLAETTRSAEPAEAVAA